MKPAGMAGFLKPDSVHLSIFLLKHKNIPRWGIFLCLVRVERVELSC